MITLIVLVYVFIIVYIAKDFIKGLKVHKATLSHLRWGFIPRFTVRERNGRFKANKVGVFYIATY